MFGGWGIRKEGRCMDKERLRDRLGDVVLLVLGFTGKLLIDHRLGFEVPSRS